jgi:sensor histidine kinase YesM
MTAQPSRDTPDAEFHPLEVFRFFRRWPPSAARNFIYTFIWSVGFGFLVYAFGLIGDARMPSLHGLAIYMLVSCLIGYSIHAVFEVGSFLGLARAARRSGYVAKVVYFSAVPLVGVVLGFLAASLVVDVGLGSWVTRPSAILSMVGTSVIVSTVLSVIFFWRERSAVAEAAVARERERSERIEREAALANLRALQAQIEPHFLFNTLANVASLVDADPAMAKRMLESFIRFLRASLAATRTESTTLAAEGELIAAYLDVLQVRMGSRLAYRVDIAEDLHAFTLPPMLLQPVVENAIRHGLEPKVDGGLVELSARREGARVAIEVCDSGMGFAPTTRGGLGLTNLRDRLRLVYAGRAELSVAERPGGGTRVRLELPA